MRATQHTVGLGDVRSAYDVVVVGAGPAGCGVASSFATRGASVLLVESNSKAARRFAGEWIHPEGARVLGELGLLEGLAPRVQGSGFVVCPNDGLGPIRLDYPGEARGFTCEHETLVRHLRLKTAQKRDVDYLEGVRAQPRGAHRADLLVGGKRTQYVKASLVVVAAGRSARAAVSEAFEARAKVPISSMAGLLIEDSELPLDGFGHVILGGPGPVLAYRIDEHRIRLCIDVPQSLGRHARAPGWIWSSFADVLPKGIREGVRTALEGAPLAWAANVFRPRRYRTDHGVALCGDAAGVFHPLTAMGITMSLLDAKALASSSSTEEYADARSAQSHVPEILSNAIYQAFVRDDLGSEAIRESIFRTWRSSRRQRARTMKLLGAASTRRADFVHAFSRVALDAGASSIRSDLSTLAELSGWLRWPWASLHPRPEAVRSRSLAWAAPETWAHRTFSHLTKHNEEKRHAK
jgi:2-polyprenyl-6-methoxyphenol hydroxylase-like FAD-dependent oxidoreductase